jgi:hypothetical protein
MKMSGSIRRTEGKIEPSVANRKSPPLFSFQDGTALPGPGAYLSGPGLFFAVGSPKVFFTVPNCVPAQRTFTSYVIPLERKSRLGAARSNFREQGSALRRHMCIGCKQCEVARRRLPDRGHANHTAALAAELLNTPAVGLRKL